VHLIKQLVLGCSMYAQDYDEMILSGAWDRSGDGYWGAGDNSWRSMVLPYCKNVQIFQCPTKRMTSVFDGSLLDGGLNAGYAINYEHHINGSPEFPSNHALGEVEDAASCILIAESDGGFYFGIDVNTRDTNILTAPSSLRHNGGMNCGFVDGHAKWLKPSALEPTSGDWLTSIEIE